jgi:aryl-alcohol dehydrogenase-like predicted oxidoreductase
MSTLSRRDFLQAGAASLTALSLAPLAASAAEETPAAAAPKLRLVKLGNTGVTVSQIAFGTGSVGYNKSSNQTRRGMAHFVELARHAYSRGIRFYDMADSYGSQPFVAQTIKTLPREKLTLGSKVWTEDDSKGVYKDIPKTIDRIRRELGSDYVDILLMHCMLKGGWSKKRQGSMDAFSAAKAAGHIRAVGVSCHNWDALVEAVETPWVDVIMARINPFGVLMDNKPEVVKALLQKAVKNGKGVIAMKIFGEGKRVKDAEREQSIRYVLQDVGIACMTLGMETIPQVDDAVEKVVRLSPAA